MILLWPRWQQIGIALLLGSVLGALLFVGYNHFIAMTLDQVANLPAGKAQVLFTATTVGLILVEIWGSWVALRTLREISTT